jgi:hypothetical protein
MKLKPHGSKRTLDSAVSDTIRRQSDNRRTRTARVTRLRNTNLQFDERVRQLERQMALPVPECKMNNLEK